MRSSLPNNTRVRKNDFQNILHDQNYLLTEGFASLFRLLFYFFFHLLISLKTLDLTPGQQYPNL